MDYRQIKDKLEKIIDYGQKLIKSGSVPSFNSPGITEYNALLAELKNVSYDDLKNYHSNSVLEIEILKKRYNHDIEKCELAIKLANNKIEAVRKIINSDKEVRINND